MNFEKMTKLMPNFYMDQISPFKFLIRTKLEGLIWERLKDWFSFFKSWSTDLMQLKVQDQLGFSEKFY